MAVTKIWPVHDSLKRMVGYAENPEKTEYRDLQQTLHYTADGKKTVPGDEHLCFVTGVNCSAKTAYDEMMAVKRQFGKLSGNVAYHAYQSFRPGEVTPEQCHEIGVKLAKRLWGKQYQVLVATHLDKNHLHSHFVINSVSFVSGRKFNDDKHCYYEMREASDALCREYGLSVVKDPKGHTPRSLYFAEKAGEPTKFNLMREAIDAAMKISSTPNDFKEVLREKGYELLHDPNRKYATLRRIGSEKAVRLCRLGEQYDIPALEERMQENQYRYGYHLLARTRRAQRETMQPPQKLKFRGSLAAAKGIGGLRGLYFHYCYLLGILPKNSKRQPLSPEMREEWRHVKEISRQTILICREKFETTDDVQKFLSEKGSEADFLRAARNKCYNRLRRCENSEEIEAVRRERDGLTKQLAALRKETKTAQGVLDRSERMRQNCKIELAMRTETRERGQQKTMHSERGYER